MHTMHTIKEDLCHHFKGISLYIVELASSYTNLVMNITGSGTRRRLDRQIHGYAQKLHK